MEQDKTKALFIARKVFAELVYDVQSLEGMPFTMPQPQSISPLDPKSVSSLTSLLGNLTIPA